MKSSRTLSRFSISVGLSVALLACSQPEKHAKKAAKPVLPAVANQTTTVPANPSRSEPAAAIPPPPPPEERTIQFIPPVVTDEVEMPPVEDVYNDVLSKYAGDVEPPPPPMPAQDTPLAYVEEPAEYPGGLAAMRKYFTDNLKYPLSAKENGIEGKCYLKFVIWKTGEISNVKVVRGVTGCKECDEEAKRLVMAMPKWNPGKSNGKSVDSYFTLPIVFKLQ